MASVEAQTFTQHLQQSQAGKGRVSITQSREIDALVNGNVSQGVTTAEAQKQTVKKNINTTTNTVASATKNDSLEKAKAREQEEKLKAREQEEKLKAQKAHQNAVDEALALQRRIAEKTASEEEAEAELHIPTVDMRKKVMRGARKVTGYRVQAFAGGNTRADKTKAQQAGNDIKMRFPDQPIYVHFYSPRWICRVGNYRSLSEAQHMLNAIKGMGYKAAVIVKGQITVFD